jgi:Icc-related predicted phosphoesterase
MIIDCVSDLHGYEPQLEGSDLLIVAGDLTGSDQVIQYHRFVDWIDAQDYRHKIVIAGNHDGILEKHGVSFSECDFHYLQDSGCEVEGLKIWGTPWSLWFDGINPHCKAFTGSESQLAAKYELIPDDTDILISHGPSWGIHDTLYRSDERVGSPALTSWIAKHVNTLKLFVCGHIHEGHGIHDIRKFQDEMNSSHSPVLVNASYIDQDYEPVNKPIRVIL